MRTKHEKKILRWTCRVWFVPDCIRKLRRPFFYFTCNDKICISVLKFDVCYLFIRWYAFNNQQTSCLYSTLQHHLWNSWAYTHYTEGGFPGSNPQSESIPVVKAKKCIKICPISMETSPWNSQTPQIIIATPLVELPFTTICETTLHHHLLCAPSGSIAFQMMIEDSPTDDGGWFPMTWIQLSNFG